MGVFQYSYLWYQNPPYIQISYQNFISENLLTCKLVHTSRGNSSQSTDVLTEDWYKG